MQPEYNTHPGERKSLTTGTDDAVDLLLAYLLRLIEHLHDEETAEPTSSYSEERPPFDGPSSRASKSVRRKRRPRPDLRS